MFLDFLGLNRLEAKCSPQLRHGMLAPFGQAEVPQYGTTHVVADTEVARDVVVVDPDDGRVRLAHAQGFGFDG